MIALIFKIEIYSPLALINIYKFFASLLFMNNTHTHTHTHTHKNTCSASMLFQEIVEDRGVQHALIQGVVKRWT